MPAEAPYLGQHCVTPYPRREVLLRWLWALVQATLFRWSPRPFHWWRAILLRMFGAEIEEPGKVVIYPTAKVMFPWKVALAPRTMIGANVSVYNLGRITLKRGANVSQNCHLCSGTHDYNRLRMPLVTKPIVIGENVWLAADVFVGPGVTIGDWSIVGARSVVVHDLPAWQVCVGNPCRGVKPRPQPS